jgi:hypothetical protein
MSVEQFEIGKLYKLVKKYPITGFIIIDSSKEEYSNIDISKLKNININPDTILTFIKNCKKIGRRGAYSVLTSPEHAEYRKCNFPIFLIDNTFVGCNDFIGKDCFEKIETS